MRYDCLIIDVHNLAYRTFNYKKEVPYYVSKKQVYKKSICAFINKIEELKETFLYADGTIYLLFDNQTSRIDLQSTFYFAERKKAYAKYKEDRDKQPKEFYNSINLLKYYYMVSPPQYVTIQVPMLEADDLVEPVLRLYCTNKTTLMVTTDYDWARYVSAQVHWLPGYSVTEPEDATQLSARMGFPISENTVVIYKSLFGDVADNIPAVVSERYKAQFLQFLALTTDPDAVPFIACKDYEDESLQEMCKQIKEQENQYRINVQIVRTIPVRDEHVYAVTTKGRDSKVALRAVQEAIGLSNPHEKFVFGNIRRPRA